MSENDNPYSGQWAKNRSVANSDDAELDRLQAKYGGAPEQPIPMPVRTPVDAPAAPTASSQAPQTPEQGGSDAVDALMKAPKMIGNAIEGAGQMLADAGSTTAHMIMNPRQTAAGVAKMLSNVNDAGLEAAYAFDGWRRGNGFTWADLKPEQKTNYASLIAPDAKTDEEKSARRAGEFLSGVAAFAVGGEVAAGIGTAIEAGPAVGGALKMAGAGAASFLAFDPHSSGLNEMLSRDERLRWASIDYLNNKKGDTALDGRMKNFFGGVLGEGLGQAFTSALSMYRGRNLLKESQAGVDEAAFKNAKDANAKGLPEPVATGEVQAPKPGNATSVTDNAVVEGEIVPPKIEEPAAPIADQTPSAQVPEEALAAADQNPGTPGGGAPAPSLEKVKPTQPVGEIFQQEKLRNVDTPIYGASMDEATFTRLSEKVNLTKHDQMQIGNFGTVEGVLDNVRVTPTTMEDLTSNAIKEIKTNPERLNRIKFYEKGGITNALELRMAQVMRESNFQRFLELNNEAKISSPTPENLMALEKQAEAHFDEFVWWQGVTYGKDSTAGQTLRAAAGDGLDVSSEVVASRMRANADLMTKTTYGGQEGKRAAMRNMVLAATDPKLVQHATLEKINENLPALAKNHNVRDIIDSYIVENLLSGPMTWGVINPLSQAIKITEQNMMVSYRNIAANRYPEQRFMNDVFTEEHLAEAFNMTKAQMKENPIPPEQIEAYRNYRNFRATVPDIAKKLESLGIEQLFLTATTDTHNLMWLAKENVMVPNSASKFGNVTRKLTGDEIAALPYFPSLQLTGAQVPSIPNEFGIKSKAGLLADQVFARGLFHPFSQTMAIGDAMMGNIAGKQALDLEAWRYASANAKDEFQQMIIADQIKRNPPPFIKQKVLSAMEEANFTTELDKKDNPALYAVDQFVKSSWAMRPFARFTTVALNTTAQALERAPLYAKRFCNKTVRQLANGGDERDEALGRLMMGRQIMVVGAALASTGVLTGIGPRNLQAKKAMQDANPGWKPDAIHVPGTDTYIPLRAFPGLGDVMKFSTHMYEIGSYIPEARGRDWEDMFHTGLAMLTETVSPDFLISENAKLSEYLRDPTALGAKKYFAQKVTGGLVPAASLLRQTRNVTDPERRNINPDETDNVPDTLQIMLNEMRNEIPGLSSTLPPARNIWAQTVEFSLPGTGPENTSPIAYSSHKDLIVEKEVERLGMSSMLYREEPPEGDKNLALTMPRRSVQEDGVTVGLNPQQYDDYVRLSAGDYEPLAKAGLLSEAAVKKMNKQNVRAQIEERIKRPDWAPVPDADKRNFIAGMITSRRKDAKNYLFQLYPDMQLRQEIGSLNKSKAHLREGDPRIQQIETRKSSLRNQFKRNFGI